MKYTVILNDNKDFVSLYKRGKYIAGRDCVVYYRKNNKGINRFGITTGKKVGNAVVRSRCRRIIRQAYKENEMLFPKGFDIVITAREACKDAKSTQISYFIKNKAIPAMLMPKNNTIKNSVPKKNKKND